MSTKAHLAGVLALVAILTGCASYTPHNVAVRGPEALEVHGRRDGVLAGAKSYFEPEAARGAFDRDVTTSFMPVMVSVRNDTDGHIALVKKEARLISADGKVTKPSTWREMHAAFSTSVTGATLGAGVVAGGMAEESNNRMAVDWQKKELGEQVIIRGRGDGDGGFIYFRRNEGKHPFTLRLVVDKLKSGESVTLDLKLPGDGKIASARRQLHLPIDVSHIAPS